MSLRRAVHMAPYRLSEKSYALSDISRVNCPLPMPCLIEGGLCGDSAWDTVSTGEVWSPAVYWLQNFAVTRRLRYHKLCHRFNLAKQPSCFW